MSRPRDNWHSSRWNRGARSPEERITFAFRRALARMPTPRELDVLRRGLERYRKDFETDKEAALQLIRHGESPPDPKSTRSLAAYTATRA